MDFTLVYGPVFAIYLGIILFFTSYKGFQYDQLKRDKNPNYNKNHSMGIINGKLFANFPIPIKDNSKDPVIKKTIKFYNILANLFWISVITIILIYVIF